jgi:hypothetical protein
MSYPRSDPFETCESGLPPLLDFLKTEVTDYEDDSNPTHGIPSTNARIIALTTTTTTAAAVRQDHHPSLATTAGGPIHPRKL